MSDGRNRRNFLADVGRGTLIAAVGFEYGDRPGAGRGIRGRGARAERLTFGELEGLVALMQETPADEDRAGGGRAAQARDRSCAGCGRRRRWPTPGPSAARTTSASTR